MNTELARAFDRIADLLEISGGDGFRINTYRRVARIIKELTDDIRVLHEAGVVREIKGIGKGTAARIEEFLANGTISDLEELKKQVPSGLPALLEIQGMGPKKVALVHDELGVENLGDLKAAIEDGRLAKLPGLGEKSVQKIAEGIAFLESTGGRTPRGVAWPVAEELAEYVRGLAGVSRVEIAGSLRRGQETIGDIDLLCISDAGEAVVKAFTAHETVKRVLASGKTKGSVTVGLGEEGELQVDLRVVPEESFGAAWQYFTGSKEHNVRLRERAVKRGWKLNEWGLFDGEKRVAGELEQGIYEALELPLIPPELREDRDEFEADVAFDDLITLDDIRGDLHMHTVASDGKNTIEEMAERARDLGYAYIAITDHSKSSTIANGLSIERIKAHIKAVREADAQIEGIAILAGCECDILPDGSLDYPDEILAECDWVVASIHAAMGKGGKDKATPTERTLAALANKYVHLIGHPSGRLINRRAAMDLDMGSIIEAAREAGAALEINASWQRLDLKDLHVRQTIAAGVPVCINTDAHRTNSLGGLQHGVSTARRGGARRTDVLNARPLAELRAWLEAKRA